MGRRGCHCGSHQNDCVGPINTPCVTGCHPESRSDEGSHKAKGIRNLVCVITRAGGRVPRQRPGETGGRARINWRRLYDLPNKSCEHGRRDDIQTQWQCNFGIITKLSACRRPRTKTRFDLPFVNSRANTIRMSLKIKRQRRKNLSRSMKLMKF